MIEKQLKQIQQKRVQSKARDNFFSLVLFMQTLGPFEAPLVALRGRRSARTLIIHKYRKRIRQRLKSQAVVR